jgi:orotate phosphoribosyltransferase
LFNTHKNPKNEESAGITAKILLEINAVNFDISNPYILTSGWASPVYVDCRKLIYYPTARSKICEMTIDMVRRNIGYETIEAIAGGETAGIPFASFIADRMSLPMCYVRKTQKTFGLGKMIEGGIPAHKNTLLVEDLATDGASKVNFATSLRHSNAIVNDVFAVFYYGSFNNEIDLFDDANLNLHYLCNWWDILNACKTSDSRQLNLVTRKEVESFLNNPAQWSKLHGGREV